MSAHPSESQGLPIPRRTFIRRAAALTGATAAFAVLPRGAFAADCNRHSGRFFRAINELPTLALIAIVVLVVVRPF